MVDDEEFEILKRKVIRRSEIQQNNEENENEQNNNEVDVQENVSDQVVTDEELSSSDEELNPSDEELNPSDEERVQDPDSSSLNESQTVFDATNQFDNDDDTSLYENQSEGTKESTIVDESIEICDNGNDIQQEANNHNTIAARQYEMQDQQADAKNMSSNDELRDKLREGIRAKIQERFKEAVQSRKRVVGEKVRFQPKRNVKTRSEYRKENNRRQQ